MPSAGARAEDERTAMRLDERRRLHWRRKPQANTASETERQADMHAIKFEGASEACARDRLHAVPARPRHINQPDRQSGQEHERLSAVGEAEIARCEHFERIARNVIDQDRNQDGSAPKINIADPLRTIHLAPLCKNRAVSFKFRANSKKPLQAKTTRLERAGIPPAPHVGSKSPDANHVDENRRLSPSFDRPGKGQPASMSLPASSRSNR